MWLQQAQHFVYTRSSIHVSCGVHSSGIFTRERSRWGSRFPAVALGSPSGSPPLPEHLPSSQNPRGLQFPASALEFSNSHRGWSAARIGCLGGAAPPSPPSFPPTPMDRVSPAWHGGPICFQSGPALSAPSLGLCLGWGPLPPCPPFISPDPNQIPAGGQPLCGCAPPPPSGSFCVCRGRGLCRPTPPGRDSFCPLSDLQYLGVFGEPSAAESGIQPLHPLPWSRSAPGKGGGEGQGFPLSSGF